MIRRQGSLSDTRATGLAWVLAAGLALSGCAAVSEALPPAALAVPRGELVLTFDEGLTQPGEALPSVRGSGTARMRIRLASARRGELRRAEGRHGYAAALPGDGSGRANRLAALVVRPRGDDQLSPGTRPLTWGADVLLEEGGDASRGAAGVLQRGLADDPVRFALRLEDGLASCRVRGAQGDAQVRAAQPLRPGEWSRLQCRLSDGRLTLRVGAVASGGVTADDVTADVGSVDFARSTPVAVGATLATGELVTARAEQFHGLLDNVFVDVG